MKGTNMMSDWSAAPAEVLRRAFETQLNALDNCAAACSCSSWRKAVNASSIGSLHLHAHGQTPDGQWTAFLKSRAAFESLKLTRSSTWSEERSEYPEFIQTSSSSMFSPDTVCKSLYLGEHLARHLADGFTPRTELQKLTLEWSGIPSSFGSTLFKHNPPWLAGLTHLTELSILMRNDVQGVMYPLLLFRIPASLQSLTLEEFGSKVDDEQPPRHGLDLDASLDHLTALTHLALTNCLLRIPGNAITCLSSLQSLSFSKSEIYVDGQLEVSRLTQLTSLDLTETTCYWEDAWVEALDAFEAWPCLRVLKLIGCNIIDTRTKLTVPHVTELHMVYPIGSRMSDAEVAGKKVYAHVPMIEGVPAAFLGNEAGPPALYSTAVVSMHLHQHLPSSTGSASGQNFWPILQLCPGLQSLHVLNDIVPASVEKLGDILSPLAHLCELYLKGLTCTDLQLDSLLRLTSLTLSRLDHSKQVTRIDLPQSLQHLRFKGSSLFDARTVHNVSGLDQLTQLVLSPVRSTHLLDDWQPNLPTLPVSLRHLVMKDWYFSTACDWSVLGVCTNLECLSLTGGMKVSPDLQSYISAAKQLHVVDIASDEKGALFGTDGAWYEEDAKLWHGTRSLPYEDAPSWVDDLMPPIM